MGTLPPQDASVQAPAFRESLAAREAQALGFLLELDLLPDRAVPKGASLYLVGAEAVRKPGLDRQIWRHYGVRVDGEHRAGGLRRLARWIVAAPNRYLAIRLFAFRTELPELDFWGEENAAKRYGAEAGIARKGARAVGMPLFGFDIDFQGGGHTSLAFGTREGLLEWVKAQAVPLLAPWRVVDTGGGFQVFLRPRRASAMRERLAALADLDEAHRERHEAALEAEDYTVRHDAYRRLDSILNASAHEAGGGVDMVADCGRALRIPGCWREKSEGRNGPVLSILEDELAVAREHAELDTVEGLRLTGEHGRLWAKAHELARTPPAGWDGKQARAPFLLKTRKAKSASTRQRAQDPRAYRIAETATPAVAQAFEALGWRLEGRVRCPVCQGGERARPDSAKPFADGGIYCHRASCGYHPFEKWIAAALPERADELTRAHRAARRTGADYSADAVPILWGDLGVEVLAHLGVRGAGELVEELVHEAPAKLWRFTRCPLCEGEKTARMLGSGHLECSRQACRAFSVSSRGGLALRDWARLAGVAQVDKLEALAREAVRHAEEEFAAKAQGRPLFSGDAVRLSRSAQDAPGNWEGKVAKAVRQSARGALLRSRFSPAVLVSPTGSGKSSKLRELMRDERDARFLVAVPSHKFAAEWIEELRALGVSVETLEGVASACEFREEFLALGSPFEWWRARRCPSCPLRDSCAAMRKPSETAKVLVVTHERVFASGTPGPFGYTLADDVGAGRRLVVDEMPDPVALESITEADYHRAEGSAKAFERRLADGMEWLLPVIRRGLDRAKAAAWSRANPEERKHGVRVEGDELRAAIAAEYEGARDKGAAFLERLAEFAQVPRGSRGLLAKGSDTPALEVPEDLLASGSAPNLAGPRWLSTVHGFLLGGTGAPSTLELLVESEGTGARWTLEARRVRHLPSSRVLVLDATANLTRPMLAAALGIEPQFHELDIERDPLHLRVWLQTNSATRGALVGTTRKTLSGAGFDLVRAWIREALDHPDIAEHLASIQGRAVRLGILSFLLVADDLRRRFKADPAKLLADLGLDPARFELDAELLGHFGRDEVGTNRFRPADLLLVIGDGCPNVGAAEATSRAYAAAGHAVSVEQVIEAGKLGKLAQGVGRSRDLFARDGVKVATVAIGRAIPPGWRAGDFASRLRRKGAKVKQGDARRLVLALWERDGRFPLSGYALSGLAAELVAAADKAAQTFAAHAADKAATPSGSSRMALGGVSPAYLSEEEERAENAGVLCGRNPPALPSRVALAAAARALAGELAASGQGAEAVEDAGTKGGRPRAVFRRLAAVLPFRAPAREEALAAADEYLGKPFVARHLEHAAAAERAVRGVFEVLAYGSGAPRPLDERDKWRRIEREIRELLAQAQARRRDPDAPTPAPKETASA
jgi:hypothetical protein